MKPVYYVIRIFERRIVDDFNRSLVFVHVQNDQIYKNAIVISYNIIKHNLCLGVHYLEKHAILSNHGFPRCEKKFYN